MSESFKAVAVEKIKRDEFVRKINKDGTMQAKTFKRSEYDATTKTYQLDDCDDMNRCVYVKRGTKLAIGFTY